jgi:hypothetical protein
MVSGDSFRIRFAQALNSALHRPHQPRGSRRSEPFLKSSDFQIFSKYMQIFARFCFACPRKIKHTHLPHRPAVDL